MYTIDVNSGRSSGNKTDVEESLVRINLEAAEEIARQLRLRNIGGLIICDFIDMRLRKNQRRVLRTSQRLHERRFCKMHHFGNERIWLGGNDTSTQSRLSYQTIFTGCPYCCGSGLVKTHESVSIEIERALKKLLAVISNLPLNL